MNDNFNLLSLLVIFEILVISYIFIRVAVLNQKQSYMIGFARIRNIIILLVSYGMSGAEFGGGPGFQKPPPKVIN